MQTPRTIEWIGDSTGYVRLIDQTHLPTTLQYRDCHTVEEVWEAIRSLRVRGAPAIGIAAAYGVVLGLQPWLREPDGADRLERLRQVTDYLRTSRPTAVNLFWALDRLEKVGQSVAFLPPDAWLGALLHLAQDIEEEDRQMCRAIGAAGADLIRDGSGILTHC
ncbi:MAG TPA: hypothetical protein VKD72_22595, partial [Gemmataceae bacterium]|nr:hypothetical protein [Gemmataceae bacterium]